MTRAERVREAFNQGILQGPPRWVGQLSRFDSIEVHPCVFISSGNSEFAPVEAVEQVDSDDEAHFFSVYGHYASEEDRSRLGALTCLADFETRSDAESYGVTLAKAAIKLDAAPASSVFPRFESELLSLRVQASREIRW